MQVTRQRSRFMPTLNSFFVEGFSPAVAEDIKATRDAHLGGDKYLGKGVWEVTEEVWKIISHYPHTLQDLSVPKPKKLVLTIDDNAPGGRYGYQEVAAEELRKRTEALLFFDTGTGKTRTTLAALSGLSKDLDALIVVGESNLSAVWNEQVQKHFPTLSNRVIVLNDSPSMAIRTKRVKEAPKGSIFIVNIESMRKAPFIEALNERDLAVCALDECQCIIGKSAQQTLGMHQVNSAYRWALSATPIKNSPLEWHSLLAWLRVMPLDGMLTRFKQYYSYETMDKFGKRCYNSFRNQSDLEDLVNLVSIRVEKVGLGLPPRTDEQVMLPVSPWLQDIRSRIKTEKGHEWIDTEFEIRGKKFPAQSVSDLFYIERVATALTQDKIDFVLSFSDEQVIVVSSLKAPLNYLNSLMPQDSGLYHGDIAPEVRKKTLEDFISGKVRVLLMTRKSGGVGLTLVNCSKMIFLDAPDNDADFNQCADRVHRIGQVAPVTVYKLVAARSLDGYAWQHLAEKQSWIDRYYEVNYENK